MQDQSWSSVLKAAQVHLSDNIMIIYEPQSKIKALRVLMGMAVFKRASLQIGRFLV